MSKNVTVVIDGVGVNATHYARLKEDEAVKQMLADGVTKNTEWAVKAYRMGKEKIEKQKADAEKKK